MKHCYVRGCLAIGFSIANYVNSFDDIANNFQSMQVSLDVAWVPGYHV